MAVDYSASSANALRRAITLAGIHGASLEIIHVMFPPNRDPWGKVLEGRLDEESSYETVVRERESKRLEEFLAPFADRLATLPTQKLCMEGESPSAAITAHVQAAEIDLTVMGSHGASWVEDFVLGSNTERLMHDSTSSVLITRARNG